MKQIPKAAASRGRGCNSTARNTMGDHRLPGSQARRTLKPTSQHKTAKTVRKDSSRCFSKRKKEPLRLPTSVENQHRLYGKERSDDFRKGGTSSEGLTPHSMESSFFPTVSRRICSPITNKNKQKIVDDSELLYPLLTVKPTRRTFWDNIGTHQNQQLLSPWPRGKDSSADILIKMLETPKPKWMLKNKGRYWEDYREATKQPTTSANQSQGKFDLEHPKLPWLCEGTSLHDGKHRGQDLLSSIYYKYIYKGGKDEWAEKYRDSMHHIDTGYENQSCYEESPVRTDRCNFDIKYGKKMNNTKDTSLSKQEFSFVIKLQIPPDHYRANIHTRYESAFLRTSQLKTLGIEETLPNELELQGENASNPKTPEQAYDPTDWKYYISKDDTTPSALEQMFMKRGWGYECSSPESKMFRDYYWIVDSEDDDDDDDEEEEEEGEEEEKLKKQQTENK